MTDVQPAGTAWGTAESRTVTWHDPEATAAAGAGLTGLEFLRAMMAGQIAPPPIAQLMNLTLTEVEPGRVVFECRPDRSAYNPIGTVHGGLVCTLADSVTGCAVHTTLAAGVGYTSVDITVNYLRPVTAATGTLTATGTVVKPGRRIALAGAEVRDPGGRLVATATSNCYIIGAA